MTNKALAKPDRPENTGLQTVRQGNFGGRPQPMSLAEVREWGEVFFQSGMFEDVKSIAAAMVKIKAGEELGFTPFVSMGGIHIIKGKASLGATLQASLLKDSPRYRYETREINTDRCILEFFEKIGTEWRSLGKSEFSMNDAKSAGLLKTGSEKGMYEKYGRNMLFSRALTNGMRWYTPDLLRSADGNVEAVDNFDVDNVIEETAEPAQDHVDGEIVEQTTEPVTEEAQPPVANPETADLLIAIRDKLNELTGGEERAVQALLKGRDLSQMSKPALVKFLDELNAL